MLGNLVKLSIPPGTGVFKSTTTDPPPTPVVPENPPTDPPDPRASNEESPALPGLETHPPLASFTAESPPPGLPDPSQSVPDTGLLEFGLDGMKRQIMVASELDLPRLELQSLELNRNPQGGFDISLRLGDDAHSIGAERKGAGTEDDLLEVPASAALGVIEEFLRARIENELDLALRFLAAHRVLHLHHDVVVVLLEAVVRGRRIPLTGAASARGGVERASILATLQATNSFVASTLWADPVNGTSVQ